MKFTAIIDRERVEVELGKSGAASIEAEIAGCKYVFDVDHVEPGVYWFNWNNRSIEIAVTPNGDNYVVSLDGRRLSVEIVDPRSALRKAAQKGQAGIMELRAPMPGKVVRVLVSEGAEVLANQGVLVMEAMKMQNEIKSPKKGIVKMIRVNQNAAVNAGDLLAVVE